MKFTNCDYILSPYSQFGNTFRQTVNSVHKLDEKFTGFRRKKQKNSTGKPVLFLRIILF